VTSDQHLLLKLIIKGIAGLLALQLGGALVALTYMFLRPYIGHNAAFGIAAVLLIGWFAAVITWMGRQWNEWYNR
jgi:hypothetical protein